MEERSAGIGLDARMAAGALLGVAIAAVIAPLIRPLFHVPSNGVGFVTMHHYPKSWDYAVVVLLVLGSFLGASWSAGVHAGFSRPDGGRHYTGLISIVVFILTFLIQDRPNDPLDFFHEGEHLTPAFLLSPASGPIAMSSSITGSPPMAVSKFWSPALRLCEAHGDSKPFSAPRLWQCFP